MKRRATTPIRSGRGLGLARKINLNTPPRRRRPRSLAMFFGLLILVVVIYLSYVDISQVEAGEGIISELYDGVGGTNAAAADDNNTVNSDANNIKPAGSSPTSITATDAAIADAPQLIKPIMEGRYADLPSPPWPQLDHRTSKAIVDGEMVGFDPSKPLDMNSHSNTIVTAYYEFTSKHTSSNYENWFQRILRASEPMIIFVEPGSKWYDFAKERRTHAPTIVAQLPFADSVMSTTFSQEFWDFMFSIDTEAKVHKGSNVYKIWNEKLIYMYAATMLNPFNTPGFSWMDAGYFRQQVPENGKPIIKVNITEDGIAEEKLVLLHVRNDPLTSNARVNIAGNSFLGTRRSFLEFYPKYYETFWDWISMKKFIGSDQFVITETCRRYPLHCHPFFPGRFKDWFAMYKMMQGDVKDYTTVSEKYLFMDEPPTAKQVPTGKRVGYCEGQIVTKAIGESIC